MKVAFIVTRFPSLTQTFVLEQMTGLLDRGHDVDIYSEREDTQSLSQASVSEYNLLDRVFYYGHIREQMPKSRLLRSATAGALITRSLAHQPWPLLKSLNVIKFGRQAASLCLLYTTNLFLEKRAFEYDIVHCHFGPSGNFAMPLKDVGVIKGKVITTFHAFDMSTYVRKNGQDVYSDLFKRGDLFLAISERGKNDLIQLGCRPESIVVHRMGVDVTRFAFVPRKVRNDSIVRILTIGRFVEKKGIEYGIRAVAMLLQEHPNVEYNIVGDGPLRTRLSALIAELNVERNVTLLGWRIQEEIISLMRDADILLAPSVTGHDGDQEGIPVVLMEALAQGLPVVSTWHGGIPELVRDGESGLLVSERDTTALAEKLKFLLMHPEVWPGMGRMGRERVEKDYNIETLNDQLVRIFERARDC